MANRGKVLSNRWFRHSVLIGAFFLVAAISFFGIRYLLSPYPKYSDILSNDLHTYGHAPAYVLTNQLNHRVESSNFTGKVQIVTFLFPYCTEYCPLIAAWLVRTGKMLQRENLVDRVQLISFNVDPAHTGPAVLRVFMSQYGWNSNDTHWQYLTGSPRMIRQVVTDGFHISYQQVERKTEQKVDGPHGWNPLANRIKPDYDVKHNDDVVLIGPDGRLRAIIPSAYKVTPQQIITIVRKLLNNQQMHSNAGPLISTLRQSRKISAYNEILALKKALK